MKQSKALTITGWVFTIGVAGMLGMSGVFKLTKAQPVLDMFQHLGFPESSIIPIGIAELVAVVVFLIPRTAFYGAILVTGYLGGAIASHVGAGDALSEFIPPAAIAVAAWIALYLRDARIRNLASVLGAFTKTD